MADSTKRQLILLGWILIFLLVLQAYAVIPTYIGDSTNAFGTGDPYSRKFWFSNGRMYDWLTNGTHLGFYSNTSLTAWSSFTAVRRCISGQHFGVVMNNSHVAYAWSNGSALSKPIYWRMGSVGSGSITWLGPSEYLVFNYTTPYAIGGWPVPILSGSNGWPYIAYTYVSTTARVALTRSLYSNGTWSTEWSREISSATWSGRYIGGSAKGTTADLRLYWYNTTEFWTLLYNRTVDTFQQRKRIDSSQAYMVSSTYAMMWSCASDNNYDVVAWLGRRTGIPINYSLCFDFKSPLRDFNITDERAQVLNATLSCPFLSLDSTSQKAYLFYWHKPTAGHFYYRARDLTVNFMPRGDSYAGYWTGSATDLLTDTPQSYARSQAIDQRKGDLIHVTYLNETSSPYHLKYANLSLFISAYTTSPKDYSNGTDLFSWIKRLYTSRTETASPYDILSSTYPASSLLPQFLIGILFFFSLAGGIIIFLFLYKSKSPT